MKNSKVGFLLKAPVKVEYEKQDDALLTFDSGRALTLENSFVHTIALGSTGSGKTASVVFPVLESLLGQNMRGLVIDIKGNLRTWVWSLARATGREDDIIEFGTSPTATPLNLLADASAHTIHSLLEKICIDSISGLTHNMDFHMKGVRQLTQCAQLLQFMAEVDAAFTPTLTLLGEMLDDREKASDFYMQFLEHIYDKNNKDQKKLVDGIEADKFHLLHAVLYREGYDNARSRRNVKGVEARRYYEQSNYALKIMHNALARYINVPGVARGFCTPGAPSLNMRDMLKKGKIVLLRFCPSTGPVGAQLSRTLIEAYYESIYNLGPEKSATMPSFVCIDEFQDVADLSGRRFSDLNFISQAREFKAAFVASTQSAAALVNKSGSQSAVEAFISNCNNRVLFYSDDVFTQSFATRLDPSINLVDAEPGQAFVSLYDNKTRKHEHAMESMQEAYKNTQSTLQKHFKSAENLEVSSELSISFEVLTEKMQAIVDERLKARAIAAEKELATAIKEAAKAEKEAARVGKSKRSKSCAEPALTITDEDLTQSLERFTICEEEKMQEKTKCKNPILDDFPEYFSEDAEVRIPTGWVPLTYSALQLFKELSLPICIRGFHIDDDTLECILERSIDRWSNASDSIAESILNSLLKATKQTCIQCGKNFNVEANQGQELTKKSSSCLCQSCLQAFNNNTLEYRTKFDSSLSSAVK